MEIDKVFDEALNGLAKEIREILAESEKE